MGVGDGILYADKNMKILDANPAFTEITGIPRENVVDKSCFDLAKKFVNIKQLSQILNILKSVITNKPIKAYELKYQDKILEISTRKHESGQSVVLIRDITARKRAEEEKKDT